MQNLEAYQNLELQKQLAKMQVIGTFQGYLKRVVSLSTAQQAILQKAGLNSAQFDALSVHGRNSLLSPAYIDPNTVFGPSLTLLNNANPQFEARALNPQLTNNIALQNNFNPRMAMMSQLNLQKLPVNNLPMGNLATINSTLPGLSQNVQPLPQSSQLLELPLPMKKKTDSADKDDLNEFFQKRVSNASTNCSGDEEEVDTGKKIILEKEIHIKNPGQPSQKARKRTKIICGHPWKNHHAKGLCKNCYETYGKTRKPWKCEHQAHFAKGYCKKCYLKLRQKISVNEIFPFAIREMKKRTDMNKGTGINAISKADIELNQTNIKEEEF